MALTYDKIATTTLGSAQSSVTFSSISGSYTDLILIANAQGASAPTSRDPGIRFNSDTGSNYSYTGLTGNGSSASSFRSTNQTAGACGFVFPTTNFETIIMHIQNYSNSTTYKTAVFRNSYASSLVGAGVNLWRSTAAITSITILGSDLGSINIASGSSFTLYGVKAA